MLIDRSQIPAPDPTRVATDAFTGYVYQCYLGVLRWLSLGDDEALLCEGDEDLDRLIFDEDGVLVGGTLEQVKHYKAVQASTVRKVLGKFLVSFHALRTAGDERRFVLTTTAPTPRTSSERALLRFVESWVVVDDEPPERQETVQAGVRRLFEGLPDGKAPERKKKQEIAAALEWLDEEPERWTEVRRAVELSFDGPDLETIKSQIVAELLKRDDARTLPPSLADRLVQDIVGAHTEPDHLDRVRTAQDLIDAIARLGDELGGWAESIQGRSLLELLEFSQVLSTGAQPLPTRALDPDGPRGLLLTAAHEVVPFDEEGRRDELDFLVEGCADDRRAGVMVLYGDGGAGKTRLMVEVCRRFRERGWIAGFLPSETEAEETDLAKLLGGDRPRLIVLDYAETRPSLVHSLLLGLAKRSSGPKTRVVLLSRKLGDWWTELPARLGPPVENLLYPDGASRPDLAVSPLAAPLERRREIVSDAAEVFRPLVDGRRTGRLPNLRDDVYEKPLYLHMAALAWLHGESMRRAGDALRRTYEHESRYWRRRVAEAATEHGVGKVPLEKAFVRALTGLTLVAGAPDEAAARELLNRLNIEGSLQGAVLGLLIQLYPGSRSGPDTKFLDPLMPDVLGEELVAQHLADDRDLLGLLLDGASEKVGGEVLTVLTRLAQRDIDRGQPLIEESLNGRIDNLAQAAFAVAVSLGDPLGRLIANQLPHASEDTITWVTNQVNRREHWTAVSLFELARAANEISLKRLAPLDADAAIEAKAERGRRLNNLGVDLGNLGRREEALQVTEEAVQIYRDLARQRPDAFRPDLASSLNNLGLRYDAVGRREEALQVTEEAVEIYRDLARQRPDAFRPDLATSLNNLGLHYDALGRREEALQVTEEAVQIRRDLARQRPDAFRPVLATSLNNLGIRYNALGRREEALQVTEEAVEIRRDLARQRSDAFRPVLASSLNNLANDYESLHRLHDGLDAAREAVEMLTPFFVQIPAGFGDRMVTMVRTYLRIAEEAGAEPDARLLEPVLPELERLGLWPVPTEAPGSD